MMSDISKMSHRRSKYNEVEIFYLQSQIRFLLLACNCKVVLLLQKVSNSVNGLSGSEASVGSPGISAKG